MSARVVCAEYYNNVINMLLFAHTHAHSRTTRTMSYTKQSVVLVYMCYFYGVNCTAMFEILSTKVLKC